MMDKYSNQIHQALARSKRKSRSLAVYIDHKPYEEENRAIVKSNDTFKTGIEIFPVHIRQEDNELVVTQYLNYRSAKAREEKMRKDAELNSGAATSERERIQQQTEQYTLQKNLKTNFQFDKLDWTLDELETRALAKGSFLTTLLAFNLITDKDLDNPVFTQLNKVAKVENIPEVNGISFSTHLYMVAEDAYRGGNSILTSDMNLNKAMDLTVSTGMTVRRVLAKGYEIHNFIINTELTKNYNIIGFKNFDRKDNQELSRIETFTDYIPVVTKFSMIPNLMLENIYKLEEQIIKMKGERELPYIKILQNTIPIPNLTSDGATIKSYALTAEQEGYTMFTTKVAVMDMLKLKMPDYPITLIMNTVNTILDTGSEFIRKETKLMHDPLNKRYLVKDSTLLNNDNRMISYELSLLEMVVFEAFLEAQYKTSKRNLDILATERGVIDVVKDISTHLMKLNSMDLIDM